MFLVCTLFSWLRIVGNQENLCVTRHQGHPPYLHYERLLTLEDTVEFFNLMLGTKLGLQEKQDLVAFLRAL